MVDITEISAIVAVAGVLVGVVYYVLDMRHQSRTRDTELVTRLASTFAKREFQRELQELMKEFNSGSSFSDITNRYGTIYPETGYFFEELGILLHRKLVDIGLVDDLFSGPIIRFWESARPYVEEARKQLNEPQYAEYFEYLYNEMKKREQRK